MRQVPRTGSPAHGTHKLQYSKRQCTPVPYMKRGGGQSHSNSQWPTSRSSERVTWFSSPNRSPNPESVTHCGNLSKLYSFFPNNYKARWWNITHRAVRSIKLDKHLCKERPDAQRKSHQVLRPSGPRWRKELKAASSKYQPIFTCLENLLASAFVVSRNKTKLASERRENR